MLSGFELYTRWVPLINDIPQAQLFLISLFVGDVPRDLDVKS